jgi:UDP-glucose 4-epimerase
MKVLVLGGCGFIGSHVVDALVVRNHEVVAFDRGTERFRAPVPGVTYIQGDFADRMLVAEALAGVDAVIHLISTTFPGTANLDPGADVSDNLLRTLSLLETMKSMGISRIVYMSSGGTVYGRPETDPIPESHPLRPINSYGIVKTAIESYLWMYARNHGLRPVAVRAANPFGPRQGHLGVQGVISTFLNKAIADQPIEIWGDGSVVRDYLHVRDLADLCAELCGSDFTGPINGGSGKGRSLCDVVDAISEVSGKTLEPVFKPGRSLDVPRSVLDISLARRSLGWMPQIGFDAAVAQTWAWLNRQRGTDSPVLNVNG